MKIRTTKEIADVHNECNSKDTELFAEWVSLEDLKPSLIMMLNEMWSYANNDFTEAMTFKFLNKLGITKEEFLSFEYPMPEDVLDITEEDERILD